MSIQVGSIIEGKVVRIKPFGAIVLIGDNKQGLVHISHVSSGFVQDINEYLAVGDIVKVKVLSIEEEGRKIALSMKETLENEERQPAREPVRERTPEPVKQAVTEGSSFEEKFKEWVRSSNERHANINKRNKRR